MNALEFLKQVPVFKSAPVESLEQFARNLSVKIISEGETLFEQGSPSTSLYFVCSGVCEALKQDDLSGNQVWMRDLGAGDIIGLTSAFSPKARSATVRAKTAVTLYEIDNETFRNTLLGGSQHSETLRCLFEYFAKNVRKKNKIVAGLNSQRSAQKGFQVAVFDSKPYTRDTFLKEGASEFDFRFFDTRLTLETASLAEGFQAIVGFVNDDICSQTLQTLKSVGVQLVALRCAGFNNVDLVAAKELGLQVTRVPAYSPHAVAEHSLALIMTLNRKTHKAYQRVREGNFRLDGLVGFDLFGQIVGVIGTGKIGKCMVQILQGMGCEVLCFDVAKDPEIENMKMVRYVDLDTIYKNARIISLYLPLTLETHHLIDQTAIEKMRQGVMFINTSRGGLVNTSALIDGLKSGKIGSAGLDVYEEESAYFFEDFSGKSINDDVLARLLTFNNVLVTSHQAFLTEEALANIASSTLLSLREYFEGRRGQQLTHSVLPNP